MTGKWLINGMDLYTVFGAYMLKGSYNELLSPAVPRKRLEHEFTDANGVSVDTTSDLTFEARRPKLSMGMQAASASAFWTRYNALVALLAQAGSFTLYVADLDKTFTLLYEGLKITRKLTRIAGSTQVAIEFELQVLDPGTATTPGLNPDILLVVDGNVYVSDNPSDALQIIDGELYLNTD